MNIREAVPEDAEEFVSLVKQVEAEAEFMMMENGERKTTPEQQRRHFEHFKTQENSVVLVAVAENKLVGYLLAIGGGAKRTMHSAYLVAGVLEKYRGQGVGTELFLFLEKWAMERSIVRLELTVAVENRAAQGLYQKHGFVVEGTKKRSLLIDEEFHDEYYMSRIF